MMTQTQRRRADYAAAGYCEVTATPEEVDEYRRKNGGHRPSVYRVECLRCGRRIWYSGLGRGSHDRAHR